MQETHLDITEAVAALRDDLKNLTLDIARLWREHRDIPCAQALLDSAVDILERSEALLGDVMGLAPGDGEPVTPEPVAPEPAAPEPAAPEPVAPEPAAPEPVAPEPAAPEPVAPEPVAPEPATPAPGAPDTEPGGERASVPGLPPLGSVVPLVPRGRP